MLTASSSATTTEFYRQNLSIKEPSGVDQGAHSNTD